ncbi:MAG: hypothetical protein NXI31_24360 [bacterium]|nr:hypothetical protein [bacterium]
MNPTLYAYTAYVLISLGLTIWVGRTLHRNGRPFLIDVFTKREDLADAVNHLLLVGFYLVNLGYIAFALKLAEHVTDTTAAVEALSTKIGLVILVLGAMHFLNLYVFSRIRRNAALQHAPRPVAPDEILPPDERLRPPLPTDPGQP